MKSRNKLHTTKKQNSWAFFQTYIKQVLAISLLFHINFVIGNCKTATLDLFDDQIHALHKSVRAIVGSCNNKNGKVVEWITCIWVIIEMIYQNSIFSLRIGFKINIL